MKAVYVVGDVLEVMGKIPDASVDLVLTSPPFLNLRSYLPDDDPRKGNEIGTESSPGAFIDRLLDVVEESRRVLAPHGSIVIELGDSYSGSGGAGGDYARGGMRDGQQCFNGTARKARGNADVLGKRHPATDGWPMEKSLCMVPEILRFALAYGFNPLTQRQTPRWRVRNVVRWCRPNPAVGALGDKYRPGTSDMVVACMARDRYFDLDAVRSNKTPNPTPRAGAKEIQNPSRRTNSQGSGDNPLGAPPLDWWVVSTEPYPGQHFATWPRDLVTTHVAAMTPMKVCLECGEPSRRIVASERVIEQARVGAGRSSAATNGGPFSDRYDVTRQTLGWTDCGHDRWRSGVVLDPFAGSGTTLAVATGFGRSAIGIDIDERNADLAAQRVGMFLEVRHGKETPGFIQA